MRHSHLGLAVVIAMFGAGCGHGVAGPPTATQPPPPTAQPAPERVTTPEPETTAKPEPETTIDTPPPPTDPTKLTAAELEPVCHELFDHVLEILRTQNKNPIKPAQLERVREQGLKFCLKKINRKIADCLFKATTGPELQRCMRP